MKIFFYSTVVLVCFFAFAAQSAVAPELLPVVDQVYGAQFEAAKTVVAAYIVAHPEDPDGYLLRGMTREWYQFCTFKRGSLDTVIMEDYEKARQLAEARLEREPNNLNYKMQLANAYVYVSKKQLDGGHKMQAGSSLKKAKNLMLEVLAKDPNNPEAFFAIGLFNYFSDNVPAGFKWLASLLGFKGDRKIGKDYIGRASQSPNLMKNDALYMLYHISARSEHDYEAALPYMAQLHNIFPGNYIFTCKKAEMEFRSKKIDEAKNDAQACFSSCDALGNDCHKGVAFINYYFMTDVSVKENDLIAGKQYYLKALATDIGEHKKTAAPKMAEWKTLFGI